MSLNEHQKQKLCVQKKMKINHFTEHWWGGKHFLMGKHSIFVLFDQFAVLNSLSLDMRLNFCPCFFFRSSSKTAHRSHTCVRSLLTQKWQLFFPPQAFPYLKTNKKTDVHVGARALRASPFLQEVDGVLQRLVLLLQLLVAVVEHPKSLSISFFFQGNQMSG